jgi:trans-2,3-dihydro-3-hydroxyanthranilate isomerase
MATTDPNTGLYLFSCEVEQGKESVRRSRMFGLQLGITEDPATGGAAGPFAAYLLRHGQIQPDQDGDVRLNIRQGVEMGRPSLLKVGLTCEAAETGEAGESVKVRDVRVGGESVLIAEGTILLP